MFWFIAFYQHKIICSSQFAGQFECPVDAGGGRGRPTDLRGAQPAQLHLDVEARGQDEARRPDPYGKLGADHQWPEVQHPPRGGWRGLCARHQEHHHEGRWHVHLWIEQWSTYSILPPAEPDIRPTCCTGVKPSGSSRGGGQLHPGPGLHADHEHAGLHISVGLLHLQDDRPRLYHLLPKPERELHLPRLLQSPLHPGRCGWRGPRGLRGRVPWHRGLYGGRAGPHSVLQPGRDSPRLPGPLPRGVQRTDWQH